MTKVNLRLVYFISWYSNNIFENLNVGMRELRKWMSEQKWKWNRSYSTANLNINITTASTASFKYQSATEVRVKQTWVPRCVTVCWWLTGNLLQEVQTGPADPRHADRYSYWCLAVVVSGVGVSAVCVQHLGAQHIIPEGRQVQRGLTIFETSQISVRPSLQEHTAVWVIAFDDGVSEQEAVLNVNVGAVVQEDPYTAGALADDSQL